MKFKEVTEYLMLVAITIMTVVNLSPEQRKEYFKVAIETIDSLNTKFTVEIQKDSVSKTDTVIYTPQVLDSVKLDTIKKDGVAVKK